MKKLIVGIAMMLGLCLAASGAAPKRPHIYGIAYVRIATSNMEKAKAFYTLIFESVPKLPSAEECHWCEEIHVGVERGENRVGPVFLETLKNPDSKDLMLDIAFLTDDVKALRKYLEKNQVKTEKLKKCGANNCFGVLDPEQHHLTFVQIPGDTRPVSLPQVSHSYTPIIHAGFVVKDRGAIDHFYKDILGFRPYWHGGMKGDKDDWVALQVPDGRTWVEYMLNISPDASKHTLGVMNHIAVGVTDIHATDDLLVKNGWMPTEEPKVGRDGKWQLNLYDPDETRVEYMEFKPKEKPCCSEFTGQHPGP